MRLKKENCTTKWWSCSLLLAIP